MNGISFSSLVTGGFGLRSKLLAYP